MDILLNGACGRMGHEVRKISEISGKDNVIAKIDCASSEDDCLKCLNDFSGRADVIIDFSNHLGTENLLNYACKNKIPAVIATTGHTDEEKKLILNASKEIPVFYSANMSLGVALLTELAVKTAGVMENADIEIVETHHNRKLDSPSGTALMIAEAIKNVRRNVMYKFGRSGTEARKYNEIGIHSVRCGNIVGIHEVIVSTDCQTITLKHEAHSRALFAEGAISAAEFIYKKPAGLYDMYSIIRGD